MMIRRPALALLYASTAPTRWMRAIVTTAGGDQAGACRSRWRHAAAAIAAVAARRTRAPAAPAL